MSNRTLWVVTLTIPIEAEALEELPELTQEYLAGGRRTFEYENEDTGERGEFELPT